MCFGMAEGCSDTYTDSTEKKHFTVAEGRLVRLSLLFEQQVQLNVELNLLRRKLENI